MYLFLYSLWSGARLNDIGETLEKRVGKGLTKRGGSGSMRCVKRTACMSRRTGGNSEEGTPVPIPNTVVKLFSSDDTLGAAPRENKKSPFHPPVQAVFLGQKHFLSHLPLTSVY